MIYIPKKFRPQRAVRNKCAKLAKKPAKAFLAAKG
jgi:hypothetical protein